MTSLSTRRARILHVRKLEHRIAKAQANSADAAVDKLDRISRRIDTLRLSLHPKDERASGRQLRAMGEMQQRLAQAQDDLAQPIGNARDESAHFADLRHAAHLREEGAIRLHDMAVHNAAATAALRTDANRPFRPRKGGGR
jgi:hypothetical protein